MVFFLVNTNQSLETKKFNHFSVGIISGVSSEMELGAVTLLVRIICMPVMQGCKGEPDSQHL
jgi:hypothetical protein